MPKIALVTGTSSGIGLSSAVALARAGFTVIATLRDVKRAGPLRERAAREGVSLDIRVLDVSVTTSVDVLVSEIFTRYGKIDVLVNNAGAGFLGTMEQTPLSEFERMMDVNFFGVVRTTKAVFPPMRAARSGRIITVSSIGGLLGQPFNDAYCAAKFAVEGLMESLVPMARAFGVHLSLIEPGPVNTEFVANVLETSGRQTTPPNDPYAPMLRAYMGAVEARYAADAQSSDDIARVIVEAATADAPHFRYPTSDMVKTVASYKYTDPTGNVVFKWSAAVSGEGSK
ncbi:SDR family oxidoreductase [Pendulispora rubella]|uniref:SDR family oxidoreductase n=1 Tax=Pendulispora rubella TaxID=2741070 RepID=A0ABZ2L187_9BACT